MCTPRIGVAAGVVTMTDQRTTFAALTMSLTGEFRPDVYSAPEQAPTLSAQ